MVRHMKLRWRKSILGIVLLVLVAAAGLVGSHMLVASRKPTVSAAPACPKDHKRALACYEQYFGSIVAQQGVPEAFAALKEQYGRDARSEEHTSELQSQSNIVCRLLLEKKNHDN